MNRYLILACLILTCTMAPSCRQDPASAPLKFKAYEGNPILSPGEPGSWDELFLWVPQIVFDNGIFYLYYLGGNRTGNIAIGFATSKDGLHFTKSHDNPIVSADNEGFDAITVGPGIVLKTDSLWLMYYNAQDIMAFAPGSAAGRATA